MSFLHILQLHRKAFCIEMNMWFLFQWNKIVLRSMWDWEIAKNLAYWNGDSPRTFFYKWEKYTRLARLKIPSLIIS